MTDEKKKKIVEKVKNKKNYNSKYNFKKTTKLRVKNSKEFSNVKGVRDDGIIILKSNEVACLLEVSAVDLSLTSNAEKENFFFNFRELFKIRNVKLKCYKLDKRINLERNKKNYSDLIDKFMDDEKRLNLLKQNKGLIEELEKDNYTLSSGYYFVMIAKNENVLNKQLDELEVIINNLSPKMYVDLINNKINIYKFLTNLYYSNVSLDQLLWFELSEFLSPLYLREKSDMLFVDDKKVQLVSIKRVPLFIEELFLEAIFNLPRIKVCINVNDTINTDELVNRLDNTYKFLLSERSTTKKLSDATEMETEKEQFQLLMSDIKNGDEKIKEVSLVLAIEGTDKERNEQYKELKRLADTYRIKLDIPKFRQMEAWQSFDINGIEFKDYSMYLPTMTLSAGFPFTKAYFNDYKGYILGYDIHTYLPIFFDPFYLNKKSRTSHNIAIVSSTGGGKSYTIKKLLVNEFSRQTKIFILDPENEYQNLVSSNGGEYIDLYSKKSGIINPLQIRYLPSDEKKDENVSDCPLPKHLGFLESFFKSAFDNIHEKELVMLLAIIEALYNKKGIYNKTSIEELEKLRNTDYPIFSDLHRFIPEYKRRETSSEKLKIINQLEILISRFVTGTDAYLFNGYTTIDLSNDLIGFNMKELLYSGNKRLINTQTINLLTYLNNAIVSNKINNDKLDSEYKKPICIVADEFHLFIDEDNYEILRNFGQLARRIRKYTGSLILATQSIEDFVGNSGVLGHAKAIFNNCQYQMVGMLKEADMSAYLELFKENPLTETQKSFLLKANQGEFLFNINRKKRLRIKISATPLEEELMGEK